MLLLLACSNNSEQKTDRPPLTGETQALYNNLVKIARDNIMFGHQDALAYGIGWTGGDFNSDVEKVSGDYPAVFGWDIGHIDSTMNIDSVPFIDMKKWIIRVFENGGVNTIGWHEKNLLTTGSSWDNTPVVDKILPGGSLDEQFRLQLDKVAEFIGSLQTTEGIKVPVIFRPYHEHNGHWFWWGAKTCNKEEYIQLWRYTYEYLRINKGIDNILFCYSTDAFTGREEYLERYPGDDFVDILGFDDYKSVKTKATRQIYIDRLETVNSLAKEKGKVAILAETGYETIPDSRWWTDVLLEGFKAAPHTDCIAYMLVWRNARISHHYAPYPGHPSSEDFIRYKNDSVTLFLSDLPDMYK